MCVHVGDLKRMHQYNEEAYLNPDSRRGTGATGRNAPTPREDRVTSAHMMAGRTRPMECSVPNLHATYSVGFFVFLTILFFLPPLIKFERKNATRNLKRDMHDQ